jgi:predicted RNase H-like HicB family nuclease
MRRVTMICHYEREGWWAEVPETPGFSAAADSLADLRRLATAGLAEFNGWPVEVKELLPGLSLPTQRWEATPTAGPFAVHAAAGTSSTGVTALSLMEPRSAVSAMVTPQVTWAGQ